jgi:hypothetical protein
LIGVSFDLVDANSHVHLLAFAMRNVAEGFRAQTVQVIANIKTALALSHL